METDEQHEGRHRFKKIAPQMWRVWSTDDDGGDVDVRDYQNVAMADFFNRANLQA
jgi:hypothetical protein